MNINGSFLAATGEGGAGMILKDSIGATLFSAVRYLPFWGDAFEAELAACMEGSNGLSCRFKWRLIAPNLLFRSKLMNLTGLGTVALLRRCSAC